MAKAKKKKKVSAFIIDILVAVFVVYVVFFIIRTQIQINEKKEQLSEINAKIAVQQAKVDEKKDLLKNGINDEYLEKNAREHGYVYPGERAYQNSQSK